MGDLPTTFRFTGQREQNELGLYFYQSRWYDAYLNRWIQPDSIIPDPYNSQDWDRYAYSRNNPVTLIDPTGHYTCNPKDCGYMTDYGGSEELTFLDIMESSGKTLDYRFKLATSTKSKAESWILDNVGPAYAGARLNWSLSRLQSADNSYDYQLALADTLLSLMDNVSSGLFVLSMGGDTSSVVGSGNAYSVAYETTLPLSAQGATRSTHNYYANKALLSDMNSDPQFAQAMEELIPNLGQQLYYRPNASPKGWTWHHVADQPGVVQLIPTTQHVSSLLQYILHPGGQGGYSLWEP